MGFEAIRSCPGRGAWAESVELKKVKQTMAETAMKQFVFAAIVMCLMSVPAGYGTDSKQKQEQPSKACASSEPAVAAETEVADEPKEIAARFREYLAGLDKLRVESKQRISYLKLEKMPQEADSLEKLADAPERDARKAMEKYADQIVSVDVKIIADMTRDSYTVTMWKGQDPRPISIVTLGEQHGVPYITERQWYPILDDYREVSYPSPRASGYDDPALHSVMFSEIESRVCVTAEFFHTWLGDSIQAEMFERNIESAVIVDEAPVEVDANAIRLHRNVYEKENDNAYRSSNQFFLVDSGSAELSAWRTELVSLDFDKPKYNYMIVERNYSYSTDLTESGPPCGIGFTTPSSTENGK